MAEDPQQPQDQRQEQHITLPDGLPSVNDSPCSPSLTMAAGSCATQSVSEAPMTDFTAPEPSVFPSAPLQQTPQGQDQLPDGAGPTSSLAQQTPSITVTAPQSQSTAAVAPLSLAAITSAAQQNHMSLQQEQRHEIQQLARLSDSPQDHSAPGPWPTSPYFDHALNNYSLHNDPVPYVSQNSTQATSPRAWASQERFHMMWQAQQRQQQAEYQQRQAHAEQLYRSSSQLSQDSLPTGMVDPTFSSPYASLATTSSVANGASLAFAPSGFGQESGYPPTTMQHLGSSYPAVYQHRFTDGSVKAEGSLGLEDETMSPTLSEFDDEYPQLPIDIHGGDGSIAVPSVMGLQDVNRPRPGSGSAKTEEPYAQLIYKALMSREDHVMSLQEIYQWFRDNTDKGKSDHKGWQNSIRHNLSMNLAFQKKSNKPASPSSPDAASHDAQKKTNEWYLEPWAVRDGVQSTTRYRKGNPSRRSRTGGLSASKTSNKRRGYSSSTSYPTSRNRSTESSPMAKARLRAAVTARTASPQTAFGLPYAPYHPHHPHLQLNPMYTRSNRHSLNLFPYTAAASYPSPPPQHTNHGLPMPLPLGSSSTASSTIAPLTPPPNAQQQHMPPALPLDLTDKTPYELTGMVSDDDSRSLFADEASDVPGLAGLMCGPGGVMPWAGVGVENGSGEYDQYRARGYESEQQGQQQQSNVTGGEGWCG